MRPAWRLATNSLWARRNRSALLIAAVALSAALVTLVAVALGTLNRSVELRLTATVGVADVRITPTGLGQSLDASLVERVRPTPEVARLTGLLQSSLSLQTTRPVLTEQGEGGWAPSDERLRVTVLATGVPVDAEPPYRLLAGRHAEAEGEVVLDALALERLSWTWTSTAEQQFGFGFTTTDSAEQAVSAAPGGPPEGATATEAEAYNARLRVRIGDEIRIRRLFGAGPALTVVGVAEQPPLGGRPQGFLTLGSLQALSNNEGRLSQIDLVLDEDADPAAVAARLNDQLGGVEAGLLVKTTERVTSKLDRNLRSSQLGFALASTLAFLSASFIIMTGLTTDVSQRQRELAVLRCVGASRGQLGLAQVFVGALVGGLGALIGVPLGLLIAVGLIAVFPEQTPSGLVIPPIGVGLSILGALGAGVLGAVWPAWIITRTSPLDGLASRAKPARLRGVALLTLIALGGLAVQLSVVNSPGTGTQVFWMYVFLGLPGLFLGYFLLGVAAVLLVSWLGAPVISKVLRLPPRMLARQVRGTPYRHGFTAGALMCGLALMVAIWTEGGAVMRDWLGKIRFPDAFVSSLFLTEQAKAELEALPEVLRTCAITIEPVEVDAFGVRELQQYQTSFIAFEPREFFGMTEVEWVEGDPESAVDRLEAGSAVIVAREFRVAQGLGLGDTFRCVKNGETHEFDIVGVVTSPGIELVSKFFNIGEEFNQQAMHAVFGSRKDLKEKLGSDQIHLIQIDLDEGVDDAGAIANVREAMFKYGILDAGSGREIRDQIVGFMRSGLLAMSSVAIVSMIIACLGVANLIAAGVEMRRFEFGVLRSLGGQRGLLARLVLGETLIVAIAASVLGTAMGLQGVLAGQRLYALLLGIEYTIRPPIDAISAGWAFVIGLALLAAWPTAWKVMRRDTRELIASRA
ncbi:MAG: FtsX-like permease family protein [Planctomycetota bacterium]